MTVKISQENGKAVVSVDGNEALKADAVGNVEVVGDLVGGVSVDGELTVDTVEVGNLRNVPPLGDYDASLRVGSTTGSEASPVAIELQSRMNRDNYSAGDPLSGYLLTSTDFSNEPDGVLGRFGLTSRNAFGNAPEVSLESLNGLLRLDVPATQSIIFSGERSERMRISSNGNVVVNNDLEVNGTTIAALIARIEALEAGN